MIPRILSGIFLILIFGACNKSKDSLDSGNTITISKSGLLEEPIDGDELALPVKGGNDTIYIFSSSEIDAKVNEAVNWVKIVKKEYKENLKSTMIVLEVDTLEDDLTQRVGQLDISNQEIYSRKFLKLTQGYVSYFSEDFSWLHYGQGNPLNLNEGVLIYDWNPSQKKNGWISDTLEGEDKAYIYGKNGYVQLGTNQVGANLSTPILTGMQNDSLLVLTFNAVAFVSKDGQRDNSHLTIQVIGGEFEEGADKQAIELNYIDNESALIITKMWENSFYSFLINKHENDPFSTTIQIKFMNGHKEESSNNRLFIDNVRLFSKERYQPQNKDNKE